MSRKWLIRTYSKQILGPVSKSKIQELVQKGILGVGDEITSGNGFWFNVNEQELFEKYVQGDVPQTFNPVSEAPNVLTSNDESSLTSSIQKLRPIDNKKNIKPEKKVTDQKALIPANEDLEFPDIDNIIIDESFDDITVVGQVLPSLNSTRASDRDRYSDASDSDEGATYPRNEDLEYPELKPTHELVSKKSKEEVSPKKGLKEASTSSVDTSKVDIGLPINSEVVDPTVDLKIQVVEKSKNKSILKSKIFYFVLFSLVISVILFVIYYKVILKRPLPYLDTLVSISIPAVSAQEFVVESEKKKLL